MNDANILLLDNIRLIPYFIAAVLIVLIFFFLRDERGVTIATVSFILLMLLFVGISLTLESERSLKGESDALSVYNSTYNKTDIVSSYNNAISLCEIKSNYPAYCKESIKKLFHQAANE